MTDTYAPVIVLGAGPAGYAAAIYAARALLKPLLVTGLTPGGQLTTTTDVENYPGFADPVQGPWLMEQMRAQAENVGTQMAYAHIEAADLASRPFELTTDTGQHYTCDALIVATGAQARWLDLPSERKFRGFGVSACATCDGFFFRGKDVVVVGGGNTAVEEALYLAGLARHVTLIHRRDTLRAERVLQERLFATPNVAVRWNGVIEEILGDTEPLGVSGVRVIDQISGARSELAVDGVFVAIGHDPAIGLFREQLRLTKSGYLWTAPGSSETSLAGVFAAGDVADDRYRQAVTAAGMGCMAALDAERYLASLKPAHAEVAA